ncbi:MAG: peptide chain release factor N(5)-glutamine methyltransferase [Candidatus Omnitrophota bacterium]
MGKLTARPSGRQVTGLISKYHGILSQAEIEILLTHLLDCPKVNLYVDDMEITDEIERQYDLLVNRRLAGEPIQYIIGKTEFYGLDFTVNRNVFIPRPETELLITEIMGSPSHNVTRSPVRVLDLCTGSGNIAVSLARMMPEAGITATDISREALNTARENAAYNKVHDRIKFLQGDLFDAIGNESIDNNNKFDIIVSNPPYIRTGEIRLLQKEIGFEPAIALDGGDDGLEFYRRIAVKAPLYLKKGGVLFLEIGLGQSKDIINIFNITGKFKLNKTEKDFNEIERVLVLSF